MAFPMENCVLETNLPLPKRRGKVRDVYELGPDSLLIVSTDRISAFDWILPSGIPGKGVILNQLSRFWFEHLGIPNHMLATEIPLDIPLTDLQKKQLYGRCMIARKAQVIPYECVVRGYLEGSGWREYQSQGSVCGLSLPDGLTQCDRLEQPLFTPATKAEQGHDINVSFEQLVDGLGENLANRLRDLSLDVYRRGCEIAIAQGLIIADTKFEWGWCNGELLLIDEALTPDSSRFWPLDQYQPGRNQPSFDKQFVREWLTQADWDRQSPPPHLPEEVIFRTQEKYVGVFQRLTGRSIGDYLNSNVNS
jgi:phosphoribosylaminoimidazole-succinocarboxamide synthase